jgi:alpha-tubulin suppressor-like RCC1 family protein
MPTFYNFNQDGLTYSFDDVFVPVDLFREGNLQTWGKGNVGQIGDAAITNRSTPVTTFSGGTDWKQVSCGGGPVSTESITAAIKTDGTLWTWGLGTSGQLGNNALTNSSTPVTTFAGGNNWKQVACGAIHMAAIKTDGTLWTWGSGINGRLGNAAITNRSTPVTTFAGGTNWKQVGCGEDTTAAIKTDGTLWTWGTGGGGRLGNASISNSSTPVTTFAGGTNWKQVDGGGFYVSAVKTDGTLWVWGGNPAFCLGIGPGTGDKSTPVTTFAGGNNWKQVSCGGFHTAAVKTDGTLWAWGYNPDGELGNASTTPDRSTAVTTFAGGTDWKQVNCGRIHTTAVKTDGTLWTWGHGGDGRLGNAAITNRSTPVTTFAGGTNWKQVESGGYHTIAVTYDDPVI